MGYYDSDMQDIMIRGSIFYINNKWVIFRFLVNLFALVSTVFIVAIMKAFKYYCIAIALGAVADNRAALIVTAGIADMFIELFYNAVTSYDKKFMKVLLDVYA